MSLSKTFESHTNNPQMDIQIIGNGDDNNNLSIQRSNGNSTIPSYEGNYQVDISSTNFELETITSSYTGLMRIYRLLYVADHCAALRNEVFLASLKYLQETHFTSFYKQVKKRKIFFCMILMNLSYLDT